jgi:hypothetical protein
VPLRATIRLEKVHGAWQMVGRRHQQKWMLPDGLLHRQRFFAGPKAFASGDAILRPK